jgi:hypothetical protein
MSCLSRTLSAERGALAEVAEVDEEDSSSDESDPGVDLLAECEHRLQHSHAGHAKAHAGTRATRSAAAGAAMSGEAHVHTNAIVSACTLPLHQQRSSLAGILFPTAVTAQRPALQPLLFLQRPQRPLLCVRCFGR